MSSVEISDLKIRLKTWEHEFIDKNNRPPSKYDIQGLPEVKLMYKQYSALKKGKGAKIDKSENQLTPKTLNNHKALDKFKSPIRSDSIKIELGPTPQIYGKTMSIFDMRISPVKVPEQNIEFNTPKNPSPASTISQSNSSIISESTDVKRKLTFDVHFTPVSSPLKNDEGIKKPIANGKYGPNSPLMIDRKDINFTIRSTPLKPISLATTSAFSPSPLIKRPLTKSLVELAKEHEAIVEEFSQIQEEDENEDEGNDEMITSNEMVNVFSQEALDEHINKKIKRRRVIRRFAEESDISKSVTIDIHKEIYRLKRKQLNEFLGDNEIDEEDENNFTDSISDEDNNKTEEAKAPVKRKTRGNKLRLVSNNFRRLKLPRKNRFKGRWGNRRR
ncbi:hypothetical protein Kpol_467p19 [Vanderwaltozyma polyspora DSM 70294]|uniref:DNA replication regulator SLD2 n=1 Tax=Vanderwaltozyma polyspora (strain ATCC 22028 / DSM 70294 / BCRC 21397 / CBS 2163 / NBRC 10782 / NRRL Y-8283 / UCD 57-17) TaxID=436907 RepID=A7TQG3_VANPO|nr:uncharacterized protein Kpol_467p19 [Vanderwaltozyma polyspora DSM 70294]EDO15507.1 hypothetical protein Kpol_467p19 [Vanderwaltozyma polyspora DSM 70294]